MQIVLTCYADGWRAHLLDKSGNVKDTTVDVYPTAEVLISRIQESKTWFDDLAENPAPSLLAPSLVEESDFRQHSQRGNRPFDE